MSPSLILVLTCMLVIIIDVGDCLTVNTTTGLLQGHLITNIPEASDDVYEFMAIPYAEPPTGKNRFRKPVPKQRWHDELDATSLPNACLQQDSPAIEPRLLRKVNKSENCLFLNIWSPKQAVENNTSTPIFFWIFGGAFLKGDISRVHLNGTTFSATQGVVFVTVQYRLGPLGFAYLGTNEVPGNMGLWDILEALKWVHKNAAVFGGDPKKITIGGDSSGAATAALFLLSNYTRPYIHRAILQSGTALSEWATAEAVRGITVTERLFPFLAKAHPGLCKKVTASSTISEKVNCMRVEAAAQTMTNKQMAVLDIDQTTQSAGVLDSIPFQPVIDGDFLPREPSQMLADGDFKKVPLLIGTTKDEGTFAFASSPAVVKLLPTPREPDIEYEAFNFKNYRKLLKAFFCFYPENGHFTHPILAKEIETHYWHSPGDEYGGHKSGQSGEEVFGQLVAMITDAVITCPANSWTDAYAPTAPVFKYLFSQQTNDVPRFVKWMGVKHTSDVDYTLGYAANRLNVRINYTEEERILSRRIMQYWGNFIKTGNPNTPAKGSANALPSPQWPQYQFPTGPLLELTGDGSKSSLKNSFKRKDCQLWTSHLPIQHKRLGGHNDANFPVRFSGLVGQFAVAATVISLKLISMPN